MKREVLLRALRRFRRGPHDGQWGVACPGVTVGAPGCRVRRDRQFLLGSALIEILGVVYVLCCLLAFVKRYGRGSSVRMNLALPRG